MKPYSVALFKRFLVSSGIDTLFINFYRSHRQSANPESLEEYLFKVAEVDNVIMNAAYFTVGATFGYDYWKEMQERFVTFHKANWDEAHADDWRRMRGHARKLLKQNWDEQQFWKFETLNAARERVDRLVGIIPEPPKDVLAEFEIVDTTVRRSSRLKSNEVSVSTRNKKYTLTFNGEVTMDIRKRCHRFAALMRNRQGDVVILINDANGVKIYDSTKSGTNDVGNIMINSKPLIEKMNVLLGVVNDYEVLRIEEVGRTDNYIAYKIERT